MTVATQHRQDNREQIRTAARELVKRTTAEQGLPEVIEDPVILDAIAAALTTARASARDGGRT